MASLSKLAAHRTAEFVALSAAGLVAVLPGIAVLSKGLWAPPGQEKAFGTAITVLSTILVLQLTLYRHVFRRMNRARVIRITTALAVVGLTALAAFRAVYVNTVYETSRGDEFVPLFWSPALERVAAANNGMARAVELNRDGVRYEIKNEPMRQWLTEGIVLVAYLVMDLCIVAVLAILGWRVGRSDEATEQENDSITDTEGIRIPDSVRSHTAPVVTI